MANNLDKIEVFVTDLDGTLFLPGTEEIPPEFFELITQWQKEGRAWIVATGRPDERLREFLTEWERLPDYYIVEERYIYSVNSKEEVVPFKNWNERLRKATRRAEKKHADLVAPVVKWIEAEGIDVKKEGTVFIFSEEAEARRAAQLLSDSLPEGYKPLRNRVHLTVAPRQIGKGCCLEEIAARSGYNYSSIFCVGDSANDLDMLDGRYGYLSGTVANAEKIAKEVVKNNGGFISAGEGGSGPVEFLEKLLGTGE